MTKTILAAAVAAIALGGVANAQGYANVGAGYMFGDVDLPTVVLRGGADLNPNFGLEAEGQFGVDSDTIGATSVELDYALAAFARVKAPVSPNASVFGRLGYYYSQSSATTGAVEVTAHDDDFAVGAGAEFVLGARTGLRLDYTNFGFDDDANQITAALVVNF